MGKIKKNRWKETVENQGRKVLTHASHLASSLFKLLDFIWQSLVDQSLKLIALARDKACRFIQNWARRSDRAVRNGWSFCVRISYQAHKRSSQACHRTKNRFLSTCKTVVHQCRLAFLASQNCISSALMKFHRKTSTTIKRCRQTILILLSSLYSKFVHFSAQCRRNYLNVKQSIFKHATICAKKTYNLVMTAYRTSLRSITILLGQIVRGSKWISGHYKYVMMHFKAQLLSSSKRAAALADWHFTYVSDNIVKCQRYLHNALHQFALQSHQDYQLIKACYQKFVVFTLLTKPQKLISLRHLLQHQRQNRWGMSSRFILAQWGRLNVFRSRIQIRAQAVFVKTYKKLYRYYRLSWIAARRVKIVVKRGIREKQKNLALAQEKVWLNIQQRYHQAIELARSKAEESRAFTTQKIAAHNTQNSVANPVTSKNYRGQFAMSSSLAVSLAIGCYLYINTLSKEDLVISPEGGLSTPPLATIVPAEPPVLIAAAEHEIKTEPVIDQKKGGYSFWPKRVTLRHVEGWGAGVNYGTDYSTLAFLLAPDYRVGKVMPMLDLRGHRFDNNKYAANVGIAGRYIPKSNTFCQILGFNLFWDWRQGHKGTYNQLGAGLEVLGKRWDFRANGYAPVGVRKRKSKCVFDQYEGGYFAIHKECEFTSYGFNAEVGYYAVRSDNFFLYTAIGPYYLVRKCHDRTRGGMFRIRPQYKDYLAFEGSISYDSVFKAVYQAQIIFYLPLYQLSKKGNQRPCNLTDYQIYQPIERYEVMPLGKRSCWRRNF